MEPCHKLHLEKSPAMAALQRFVDNRWQRPADEEAAESFESFERELHERVLALEREVVAQEMARFDVVAQRVEVGGTIHRLAVRSEAPYVCAAGEVRVERNLFVPCKGGRAICPLELRLGVVAGQFTPRAARQITFLVAQLPSRDVEEIFVELGGMHPSRSSIDRVGKVVGAVWEEHRQQWEAALRQQETVPLEAQVLALSLDGVMIPMRGCGRRDKRSQPHKRPQGPAGFKEAGCGTVSLHDGEGERLHTLRYARMPQAKKATLTKQLRAEVQGILSVCPDLVVVKLADGAKENWRFLSTVEAKGPEIVDFYHASEHLKGALDVIFGEGSVQGRAEFERLRLILKEDDKGAERVIKTLAGYRRGLSRSRQRRLDKEVGYFKRQKARMHYAAYQRQHLPIASGVVEAACKTLVTERMKGSGMAWSPAGGQAILTVRSLIQSGRWSRGWALFAASQRQGVYRVIHHRHLTLRQAA